MRLDRSRAQQLVGREAELADLLRAAEGGTRMLLLAGDAGVGKTRLLTEALDRLQQAGWRVRVGHCLDLGATSMPYLPFAEMLDGADDDATETHPALRLLHDPDGSGRAGVSQAEVFEAVHGWVDELAAAGPVVLVVEDAHWADASTRDLLSFLLSRRLAGRCLVLVTLRSDEMHRRHPLRQQAAEWVRRPGVERVQLDPLPPAAVRALVESILGPRSETDRTTYDDDLERIVTRAQGNAFYVEELVGAFLSGGWSLPDDLADLLLVRLDRLDDEARDVVRVAAAAGQRVSHDLLAAVAPVDADGLDRALRAALDASVLVRTGENSYAFRHALLGEAVYDDLLPGERMRLHTSYAEAVRRLLGSRGAADLARHALASHDLPTALLASVEAGDRALATGGPDEAARHYTRALEIHDRAARDLDDPPDEGELVLKAVEALGSAGRPETALALAESHLAHLGGDAAPVTRASLLLAEVEAMRTLEPTENPATVCEEALRLLGEEPSPLRTRVLASYAQALLWADRFEESRVVAEEVVELAETQGLPRLAVDAGLTLIWLSQRADRGESGRLELRRIIDEARARGDVTSEVRAHLRTAGLEYDWGDLPAAQESYLAAWRLSERAGRPWAVHGTIGRVLGALIAVMRGHHDEALSLVDTGGRDAPPTSRALLDVVPLAVAAARGDESALAALPGLRERWHRDGMIVLTAAAAAIELQSRRDGAATAVATYDDAVVVLTPIWGEWFGGRLRLATLALAALTREAPHTASAERVDVLAEAERLVGDGRQTLRTSADLGLPLGVEGQAWESRLTGERLRLDWLLGEPADLDRMREVWRECAERFSRLGHPLEEARARVRLGEVLRAAGEVAAARAETEAARSLLRPLGPTALRDEIGTPAADPETDGGPLTPREHEILALVAEGRSNGEIGGQLFISAKTVSVHVSNAMAKLGAASRTEAVAQARRRGLLA